MSGTWLDHGIYGVYIVHGSYGVYIAVTGFMWLIRLYVSLFFSEIAPHGSYMEQIYNIEWDMASLWHLRGVYGCYGVYIAVMALRLILFGTDLHAGMTVAINFQVLDSSVRSRQGNILSALIDRLSDFRQPAGGVRADWESKSGDYKSQQRLRDYSINEVASVTPILCFYISNNIKFISNDTSGAQISNILAILVQAIHSIKGVSSRYILYMWINCFIFQSMSRILLRLLCKRSLILHHVSYIELLKQKLIT